MVILYVGLGALGLAVVAIIFATASVNAEANRQDTVVAVPPVAKAPHEFLRAFAAMVSDELRSGNQVDLFQNGDEIFPPMLEAIARARSSVHFSTYVYDAGKIPDVFATAFAGAAQRGVEVRVVLDRDGAKTIQRSRIEQMQQAGCRVHWFRAAQWYDWEKYNRRTHRRLLIVDGDTGFTGGVGIADTWAGDGGDPAHWRDTHARVTGPVVSAIQGAFVDTWNEATGELLLDAHYFPTLAPTGETSACFVRSNPANATSAAQRSVAALVAGATRSLYVTNAYFVPTPPFVAALSNAKTRGVDVKILMPGPFHNKPAVRRASRSTWKQLLRAGVELYEHQRTMVHAKVVVVDGQVTMVGSINFDPRSFALNAECAIVTCDPRIAESAIDAFTSDLAASRRVTIEDLANLAVPTRIVDALAYWARAQL